MREAPTTEAGSRFAELLRIVEHGESIAITRHGRTVAHLVPAADHERASRKEAVEHREAQFVDDGEMAEILNDDALVRRLRTGSREARWREGVFVARSDRGGSSTRSMTANASSR